MRENDAIFQPNLAIFKIHFLKQIFKFSDVLDPWIVLPKKTLNCSNAPSDGSFYVFNVRLQNLGLIHIIGIQ
jgi:hypothetical protein